MPNMTRINYLPPLYFSPFTFLKGINAIVLKSHFSADDADANELTARLNSLDCDWRSRLESHTAALVIRRENRPKAVDEKLEKCQRQTRSFINSLINVFDLDVFP
jgi:hypothetical protein